MLRTEQMETLDTHETMFQNNKKSAIKSEMIEKYPISPEAAHSR